MEFDEETIFRDNRKPAAVNYNEGIEMMASLSAPQSRAGSRRSVSNTNANGINLDESTAIIENILSAIEHRGENGLTYHGGPLSNSEIVKLSMLCTQQIDWSNRKKNGSANNNGDSILREDIGFADVDADMMAQLVEHLEKHVATASQIDLIQSSYDIIQKLKKDGGRKLAGCSNIDEVSRETDEMS